MSEITNMADKASIEPNRNGGPGNKCCKKIKNKLELLFFISKKKTNKPPLRKLF